jgi:uncharacterized membrane protein YhaH (DUF805 family)
VEAFNLKTLALFLFGFLRLFYFDRVVKQKEFILIIIGVFAYGFLQFLLGKYLSIHHMSLTMFFSILYIFGYVAQMWILIAAISARLRDVNKNQLFLLLIFIPFGNIVFILYLCATASAKVK